MSTHPISVAALLESLRQVVDPELGCNIVDLGLLYDIRMHGAKVFVKMTLTTPGCPMHESICLGVRNALLQIEAVAEVEVELVWNPPWHPSMMTDVGRDMTGVGSF